MDFSFVVKDKDKKTHARLGVINTPHGKILTPSFAAVGTKASVKGVTPGELKSASTQVVLANAYHLFLRPGIDVIQEFGGFAPFMDWRGPTITDSGGYQVSFMWSPDQKSGVRITDRGVYFRSHIDGTKHFFTPERSMEIQRILGADMIMAFDQPMSPRFSPEKNKEAFERTLRWEERSFTTWQRQESERKTGSYQALFGIIQGETDPKMRRLYLDFILSMGFPGIAIGDESIGVSPEITAKSLDTIADFLPNNKPLHALGLGGGPEGIFEAVERGVDTFDNSSVTRMARTGIVFMYPEDGGIKQNKFRTNIRKSKFANSKTPLSRVCRCFACTNFSAGYINHLLINDELLGLRLTTIHNISLINDLMYQIRKSIKNGDFNSLKRHWLD